MKKKNVQISLIVLGVIITISLLLLNPYGLNFFSELNKKTVEEKSQDALAEADNLFLSGKYEDAFSLYTKIITENPNSTEAYTGRANVLMQWRRFDDAIVEYTRAISLEKTAVRMASRCNAYRLLSEFELAEKDCMEAIQIDPLSEDAHVSLSILLLEKGDITEARNVINRAIEAELISPDIYYALSQIEIKEGDVEAAIHSLSKCIELDSTEPVCYWERGYYYYMIGKIPESTEDLQKVLEIANPETDGELLLQAGTLLNSFGNNN